MPQAYRLELPCLSPKQQVASKTQWNQNRAAQEADFFTFGYSGRKLDEIISSLRACRIKTVLDIRQNPVSMYRPEISKTNFSRTLFRCGIGYVHLPQLGVPRDIRAKAIEFGTRDVIWEWYNINITKEFVRKNLHYFLNAFEHPVAFMCTEIDPQECHRHCLACALEQSGMKSFDL
jgi:uncharacterized protein (DUF488 family)